ncbi:MAG: universal stress protein [Spongiibacteraceae bacterium]
MTCYKTLLVAIDLEGGAEAVLAKAKELQQLTQARLVVINAAYISMAPYAGAYGAGLYAPPESVVDFDVARQELLSEIAKLLQAADLHTDATIVEFGRPVDLILEQLEKEQADMIVLGSHGRHGIGLLLGSTANAVLHRANCDVLAVRI